MASLNHSLPLLASTSADVIQRQAPKRFTVEQLGDDAYPPRTVVVQGTNGELKRLLLGKMESQENGGYALNQYTNPFAGLNGV